MDTNEIAVLIEKIRKPGWRKGFLWGLGILIAVAVVATIFSYADLKMNTTTTTFHMTVSNFLILSGAVAGLCLVWLAIFLEDVGIPLAALIAGLIWAIMTVFAVELDYGAPYFLAGGCLLGGSLGGIVGGIVRKLTKRGKAISVSITIMGAIVGAAFGYVVMVLVWWQIAYSY